MSNYYQANIIHGMQGENYAISIGSNRNNLGGYINYFKHDWISDFSLIDILVEQDYSTYTQNDITWFGARAGLFWFTNSCDSEYTSATWIALLFYPNQLAIGASTDNPSRNFYISGVPGYYENHNTIDCIDVIHSQGTDLNTNEFGFLNLTTIKNMTPEERLANYDINNYWIWFPDDNDGLSGGNTYSSYAELIARIKSYDKYLLESFVTLTHSGANVLYLINLVTSYISEYQDKITKTYTNSTWSTKKTFYIKTTFSRKSSSTTNASGNVVNYEPMLREYIPTSHIRLYNSQYHWVLISLTL